MARARDMRASQSWFGVEYWGIVSLTMRVNGGNSNRNGRFASESVAVLDRNQWPLSSECAREGLPLHIQRVGFGRSAPHNKYVTDALRRVDLNNGSPVSAGAPSPHYSRLAADLSEASGIGRVDGGFRGGFSLRVGD